jgi:guanylate kinase
MSTARPGTGSLFVVSAPSGAGKHTVLHRVLAADPRLEYSVSATTRAPRPGEVHGRDYYFLDRGEFGRRVEQGGFVEWAEVHGNLYGTLREELERRLSSGKDVVLEIDIQGMRNLKQSGFDAVTVFIMPPSPSVLERRLRGRGTESPETVELRLRNAREEMEARHAFDYIVVNDRLSKAVADLKAIVRAQRCRADKQP